MKVNSVRLGINVILSLACLALLVIMIWQYLFNTSENNQAGIQLIQATPASTDNYSWRWFGQNSLAIEQNIRFQQESEEQFAEADINAELIGVVMTQDISTATIRINGQQEKVYSIGDELQSGVELLDVGTSRVVLRERGREVQISMRKPTDLPVQIRNQAIPDATTTSMLQDGFSLANMFDALPVQIENAGTGIQLGGISEEMLSLSELQDGDVVMQVGSTSINELMSNPGQWMSYTTETMLPVTVMRDGQETTLNVNAFSLSARILPNLTSELMQ